MEYPSALFSILLVLAYNHYCEASPLKFNNKNDLTQENVVVDFVSPKNIFGSTSTDFNQENDQLENRKRWEEPNMDSLRDVKANPIFHFRHNANANKNGDKRLFKYKLKLSGPYHYKSIIKTKLRIPLLDDPFFPHVDPMSGFMDDFMNDFMGMNNVIQPNMLNKWQITHNIPKPVHSRNEEENSSLKFWIKNDNVESTTENNLGTEGDDEDYKTDLWKKYMKNEPEPEDSQNITGEEESSDPAIECENGKDERCIRNYLKKNENNWWTKLALPWKPKIYRQHKKDIQENKPDFELNYPHDDHPELKAFNRELVGLEGDDDIPVYNDRPKRNKHNEYDAIIAVTILGLGLLIVYQMGKILRQEFDNLKKRNGKLPVPVPGYLLGRTQAGI